MDLDLHIPFIVPKLQSKLKIPLKWFYAHNLIYQVTFPLQVICENSTIYLIRNIAEKSIWLKK